MCTLLVSWCPGRIHVAANRDEAWDRPADPPRSGRAGPYHSLWPRDRQAGGTWIGVNEAGVFAALTNRFGAPPNRSFPSRGRLVPVALRHAHAAAASAALADLVAQEENGFHLVVADDRSAWLHVHQGDHIERRALAPGVHVVTERSFGPIPTAREAKLRTAIRGLPECPTAERLAPLLEDRQGGFDAVTVRMDERRYGTRSRSLVSIEDRDLTRFAYAEVHPSPEPFVEYAGLLRRKLPRLDTKD
jgi:hypothetical protein